MSISKISNYVKSIPLRVSETINSQLSTIPDITQTPSQDPEFSSSLIIKDGNSKNIGGLLALNNVEGTVSVMLVLSGDLRNNNDWNSIRLSAKSDGTIETRSPSPVTNSNTNNIATTEWVRTYTNSKLYNTSGGSDITSAWSTGEWTNNLGDGWIVITIGPTLNQQRWTLYDSYMHILCHFGSVNGDSSTYAVPIFVKNGVTYLLKTSVSAGYSDRAGLGGTSTAPHWAYFYPTTNN